MRGAVVLLSVFAVMGLLLGCVESAGNVSPAPLRATARVAVERADSAEWLATAGAVDTRVVAVERETIARARVIETREAYKDYSTQVAAASTRDAAGTHAAYTSTAQRVVAERTAIADSYTRTTYAVEWLAKRTSTAREEELAAVKADSERVIAQWSAYLPVAVGLAFALALILGAWLIMTRMAGYIQSLQMQNLILRDREGVPVVLLLPRANGGSPDIIELPTRLLPAVTETKEVEQPKLEPEPVVVVTGRRFNELVEDLVHYDDLETFVRIIVVTGNWTAREWGNKQVGRFLMGSPGSTPPSGYDRLMELFIRRGVIIGRDAATRKPGTMVSRDVREIMSMLTGRFTTAIREPTYEGRESR